MKKYSNYLFINLITMFIAMPSFAGGYTENLYLCDLGMKSSNIFNERGVDFIQYVQNGRNLSVNATPVLSSALSLATNNNSLFDRWSSLNGITDVSINLESDFYGTQYFLEYCYTWDRVLPTDNINYDVTFISSLVSTITSTQFSVDTRCSIMANNGAVVNTLNSNSFVTTNLLSIDFSSMRCTIRLNFKEDTFSISRPHNGGLLNIDPNITVRVSP
jgi:hypothetical protein